VRDSQDDRSPRTSGVTKPPSDATGAGRGTSSGTTADGTRPQPGGWNRFSLQIPDLEAAVEPLRAAGVRLRTDLVVGIGGNQVLVEDPSGNPVELFQPTRPEARAS
jgi:catechol 2,3-dioxygenase-like lactoylglutathione lyase family enzyme